MVSDKTDPEDSRRQLIKASNEYMAGRMSQAEYRKIKLRCTIDYNAVLFELGKSAKCLTKSIEQF